jgi:hypothetical protein
LNVYVVPLVKLGTSTGVDEAPDTVSADTATPATYGVTLYVLSAFPVGATKVTRAVVLSTLATVTVVGAAGNVLVPTAADVFPSTLTPVVGMLNGVTRYQYFVPATGAGCELTRTLFVYVVAVWVATNVTHPELSLTSDRSIL